MWLEEIKGIFACTYFQGVFSLCTKGKVYQDWCSLCSATWAVKEEDSGQLERIDMNDDSECVM